MPLRSKLFRDDMRLQACLISDPAHVVPDSVGDFVGKIQRALTLIDGAHIDAGEQSTRRYGPSTALAVLAYKRKRNIVNRSYQTQADNIVGRMTIESLDKEMAQREQRTIIRVDAISCRFDGDGPNVA
jgi:hypothetical protein